MSSLRSTVRKLNVLQTNTPAAARLAQSAVVRIGGGEIGTAARWGGAVGLIAFWLIEPYDWIRSLREGDPDAK